MRRQIVLRVEEIRNAREAEGCGDNLPEPGDGDQPGYDLKGEL